MAKKALISKLPAPGSRPRTARVQDWPTLLFHFIESRRSTPFAWGRHDCCLFAADGILAQTGLDLAAGIFRGKYRDALGAARLVRKHGGIEAIAVKGCARFGYKPVPVLMAQRGDMVLLPASATGNPGKGPALGVCVGAEAAFPGASGLVFLPMASCRRAWRIG
jgi:hypothetical protein